MTEWSRDTPWRQGHLLGKDALVALDLRDLPEDPILIIASQDCDIVQSPEIEPVVEVIVGHRIKNKDGNCTHAKNARKLHLEFAGTNAFWGEFDARRKIPVEKSRLTEFVPLEDVCLLPKNRSIFQIWLASRYRRSAFPDEFERRLISKPAKLDEKIAKAVRPHGELITGVFFDVDEGLEIAREGEADTYTLDILLLHAAEPDIFDVAELAATKAASSIAAAFRDKLCTAEGQWRNIELRSCEPVSESVLTYQQFKQLKRCRLDHISLAAEPQQAVAVE